MPLSIVTVEDYLKGGWINGVPWEEKERLSMLDNVISVQVMWECRL